MVDKGEIVNYDCILQNRIKYGNYYWMIVTCSMILSCLDGMEIMIISIIVPIMKKDLKMTKSDEMLITQTIFLGEIIGSIIGGYLGDKYGRKHILILSNILCVTFGFLSSFSESASTYIMIRIVVGIGLGMIIVITLAQINEVCCIDDKYRNQSLFFGTYVSFSMGQLFLSLIAYFCFQSIDQGDWRLLIRLSNLVPALCLPINFMQSESIKYQLEKLRFKQAFDNIDQAIKSNNSQPQLLTQLEKQQLTVYYQNQSQIQQDDSYKPIFSTQYRSNTILISLQFFYAVQVFFAIALFMPIEIAKQYGKNQSASRIIMIICILPEIAMGIFMMTYLSNKQINSQQIQKGMYISTIATTIATYVVAQKTMMLGLIKMFVDMQLACIFIQTAELYPTLVKGRILGFGTFFGRIGGIIMPTVMYYVVGSDLQVFLSFLLVLSVVFMYLSTLIDYNQNSNYCKFEGEEVQL